MTLSVSYSLHAGIAVIVLSALGAGCASSPKTPASGTQVAATDSRPCKTTRNVQSPGPQPASNPPRCANSVDAGKLPATAIGTIMVSH